MTSGSTTNDARGSRVELLTLNHAITAMIQVDVAKEIDRLLSEGALSQRQIAVKLRVSRGTVNAIATGRRRLHGAGAVDHRGPQSESDSARCPTCGYRVYAPCLICSTRAYRNLELQVRRIRLDIARAKRLES
jgi:predicted XRE-type DNA-binding protein